MGKFHQTLCELMQMALRIIERWCLSVNPTETELILFTRKRKNDLPMTSVLFGISLTMSKEVNYLGHFSQFVVIFDHKQKLQRQ